MSFEEALEYYDFNIEGAMGRGQYFCIDDTLTNETIEDMIKENEVYDPPTHD